MTLSNSPLRLLVKSYANGLLDRKQYLSIRQQMLKKLSVEGEIKQDDLQNFLKIQQNNDQLSTYRHYSASDWIIIILGLVAASALIYLLYF